MIYAVIAFGMFIIFDFNKIIWNDKRLNMLFMLGILILAYGSYDCFIKGKSLLWIAEHMKKNVIFVVLAVFGIWKTCSVFPYTLQSKDQEKNNILPRFLSVYMTQAFFQISLLSLLPLIFIFCFICVVSEMVLVFCNRYICLSSLGIHIHLQYIYTKDSADL